MKRRPHSLTHHGEADEDDRSDHSPHDFQPIVTMRIGRALGTGAVTIFPDDPTEADLRGSERYAYHDDGDHELAVNAPAVLRDRLGKPPASADEHPHRGDRDPPDYYSQK